MYQAIESICDRLADRTATLFLGAGVNFGITDGKNRSFPLGDALANMLGRDLLGIDTDSLSLQEAAEMARHRLGDKTLNDYLHELFTGFPTSSTHISLLNLPWDCVFTTNYDTLLEKAHQVSVTKYHRRIQAIFTNSTDVSTLGEDVLVSYKLHGCIDYANTSEGKLIITQSDYRYYETNRRRLFRRLEKNLQSRCIVFLGYSLKDSNFLASLSDACEELDVKSLPRSYAVRTEFTDAEEQYWLDRYNIQLLKCTAEFFVSELEKTWQEQQRTVLTSHQRLEKQLQIVDAETSLPIVANAFHQLSLGQITGQSNPTRFFRGGEPLWPDIRDEIPPKRKGYWSLMEAIFPELSDPSSAVSMYLVTGSAGTGKTTLLKTVCYDLLKDFDSTLPVLLHIPGVPINASDLASLTSVTKPQRIVIAVTDAATDYEIVASLYHECVRLKLPVTLLLEERKNQWLSGRSQRALKLAPTVFEVGELDDEEIEDILDALSRHRGCLGSIESKPRTIQSSHFKKLAKKDLLVALRELTSESSFDSIIKDEFNMIPSTKGRQAYLYAAAFGQIDLALRYETLQHLLQINFSEFSESVFNPTEGILLTSETSGYSRHNIGYRVRVRHPIVASIIFAEGAPDDDSKFEIINQVLGRLDPGYAEDRRVLQAVIRRKELVNTFADYEKRRALFTRLATIMPDEPYVLQHRSIIEREMGNGEEAIRYARQALRRDSNNLSFKNTLGFALEFAGRTANGVIREGFYREAKALFDEGIARDRRDPFGYLGVASLMKQRIVEEIDYSRATVLKAELLAFLEEAYEATGESPPIAHLLAQIRASIGSHDEAIKAVKKGLALNCADTRLRVIWIDIEVGRSDFNQARIIAMEGIQNDPTAWRLHRHLARINKKLHEPASSIAASYHAAIRHHKSDCALHVEFGAFLFTAGQYEEAASQFREGYRSTATNDEAKRIREAWRDENGDQRRFKGKVVSTAGASGYLLAIPENFRAFFWRTSENIALLQEGDEVTFTVGFNTFGPIAHIIRRGS